MIPKEVKQKWYTNDLDIDIRQQWVDHLGDYRFLWPRDFGNPVRWEVSDPNEYVETIERYRSHKNCYVQVFSDLMQKDNIFDTVYIDIDVDIDVDKSMPYEERVDVFIESISDAYDQVQNFCDYMAFLYNEYPRVYFSGSKGFSIYTDFEPTKVNFGAPVTVARESLKDSGVDLDIVDMPTVKDKNRVSRPPYTINWNNRFEEKYLPELICLPVNPRWATETVIDEIFNLERLYPVKINRSEDLREVVDEKNQSGDFITTEYDDKDIPDAMEDDPEKALGKISTMMDLAPQIEDGRKRALWAIMVPNLIEAGYEQDDIHRICRRFIKRTGKSYSKRYRKEVETSINQTIEGPSKDPSEPDRWKGWDIKTFLMNYPELLSYYEAQQ